jgi:hypothetical protein
MNFEVNCRAQEVRLPREDSHTVLASLHLAAPAGHVHLDNDTLKMAGVCSEAPGVWESAHY